MATTLDQVLTGHDDVVSGIFKFSSHVPIGTLVDLAIDWHRKEHNRVLSVSVRGCAEDMNGIDFRYIFRGETYKKDMHRISRQFESRVGKYNLKGWSVSSPTYIIK